MTKRVEIVFSMAVSQIISVERVMAAEAVLMAVLMKFPMLFSIDGSLQAQV
jgi:hypothetical protein